MDPQARGVHVPCTWVGGTRGTSMSTPRPVKVPRGARHRRYENGTVPQRSEHMIIVPFSCRVITVQARYILRPVGGAYTPMVAASLAFVEKGVASQLRCWPQVQNVSGSYNNELIVIGENGLNRQLLAPPLWWPPKGRVIQLRTKSPRA